MDIPSKIVFIDCGAHRGESLAMFLSKYSPDLYNFKYYGFEPNEELDIRLCNSADGTFTIINKAVSDHNGIETFYVTPFNTKASSLYANTKKVYGYKVKTTVECIDLSEWIEYNIRKKDTVVLKLNVEGEEYKIIPKLLKDNTIDYVDDMYIEFHNLELRPDLHTNHTRDGLIKAIKDRGINLKVIKYNVDK